MAYSLVRSRCSVLSRISAQIANSFESNLGHRSRMSTLETASRKLSPPPWLLMPPAFKSGGKMCYRFYNLAEDRVELVDKRKPESEFPAAGDECEYNNCKLVGSSHGWLALFHPRNNNLFLSNPITGRHIKLPPIETLPDPGTNLTRDGRGSVSKVILSCCPDTNDDDECRAMMTFGPGDRLAFCHPGLSTEWTPIGDLYFDDYKEDEWNFIPYTMNYGRAYEDFVYCSRRKVFCCTTQLEIDFWKEGCPIIIPTQFEVWDLFSSPEQPKLNLFYWHWTSIQGEGKCSWLNENRGKLMSSSCRQIPYLVYAEQHDQLFVVIRFVMERVIGHDVVDADDIPYDPVSGRLLTHLYPYQTVGFCVLKLDYQRQPKYGYEKVEMRLMNGTCNNSLDGLAMFVGTNHSFALSAADEEVGLKPNSIYFTDSNKNPTLPPDSKYGGHDIGIFDYENKTISPYYYPCDVDSLRKIVPPPMWFTPTPH